MTTTSRSRESRSRVPSESEVSFAKRRTAPDRAVGGGGCGSYRDRAVSTHKIAARRPDVPRDPVECRRSPDCHDLTISSVFRGIKSIEFLRPGDVVAPDHNMAEH